MTDLNDIHPNQAAVLSLDAKQEAESMDEWKDKSLAQLKREHERCTNEMVKIADQMGEDHDLTAVTGDELGSGTPAERADMLTKKKGHWVAIENLIRNHDDTQKKIRNARKTGFAVGHRNADVDEKDLYFAEDLTVKQAIKNDFAKIPSGATYADMQRHQDYTIKCDVENLIEFKNAVTYKPEVTREPGVVLSALTRIPFSAFFDTVVDPTNGGSVKWMEQTVNTDNTSRTGDGDLPGKQGGSGTASNENVYKFAEKSAVWEKFVSWITVTEEQLQDIATVVRLVETLLPRDHSRALSNQMSNGSGSSGNWSGILTNSSVRGSSNANDTTLTRKAADSWDNKVFASILTAKTSMEAADDLAMPSVLFMHPTFYKDIRLITNTNGNYYLGGPSSDVRLDVWGLQPVPTSVSGFSAGSTDDDVAGLICDPMGAYVHMGRSPGIEIGTNSDDFLRGKRTMRVASRGNVALTHPGWFKAVRAVIS